jgi:hypothetical protein
VGGFARWPVPWASRGRDGHPCAALASLAAKQPPRGGCARAKWLTSEAEAPELCLAPVVLTDRAFSRLASVARRPGSLASVPCSAMSLSTL